MNLRSTFSVRTHATLRLRLYLATDHNVWLKALRERVIVRAKLELIAVYCPNVGETMSIRAHVRLYHELSGLLYLRQPKPDLRILTYHHVPPFLRDALGSQLDSISRERSFLRPEDFSNNSTRTSPGVLVTFDDGFESAFRAYEEVLRPRGIRAIYFVVTGLIGGNTSVVARHRFLAQLKLSNKKCVSGFDESQSPMSWEQASQLIGEGNEIGSHSDSHLMLPSLSDREIQRELVESKVRIADNTGRVPQHFALPFGSYDARVLALAVQEYSFVHLTVHGPNSLSDVQSLLFRETIEPCESARFAVALTRGALDHRSCFRRRCLRACGPQLSDKCV